MGSGMKGANETTNMYVYIYNYIYTLNNTTQTTQI